MPNLRIDELAEFLEEQHMQLPPEAKVTVSIDLGDVMYLTYDLKVSTELLPGIVKHIADTRQKAKPPVIRAWFNPMSLLPKWGKKGKR